MDGVVIVVDNCVRRIEEKVHDLKRCLLYTSDAADERSSVDLGGRRIIKKKKSQRYSTHTSQYTKI